MTDHTPPVDRAEPKETCPDCQGFGEVGGTAFRYGTHCNLCDGEGNLAQSDVPRYSQKEHDALTQQLAAAQQQNARLRGALCVAALEHAPDLQQGAPE